MRGISRPVGHYVIVAMVLSAFGPYIVGGIRTEQAVVYFLAIVALVLRVAYIRPVGGLKFFIPWSLLFVIATLGEIFPPARQAQWSGGGLFAGIDNLLLPIAVMLTVWCVVTPSSATPLLRTAGKIVVWGLVINAGLAIADTVLDLSTLLRPFWASEGAESTVGSRAVAMGRLSGIINQPSAAGFAYSLAGLLAIYIYGSKPRKLYLALGFITVGGLLSVSKAFLLIGAPLILLYTWRSRAIGGKVGMLFAALTLLGIITQSGLLREWAGVEMLGRTLTPAADETLISHFTAGRWAANSSMFTVIGEALRVSPVVGVGAGGWSIAYDSSWTQAIVVAGLLGAACLLSTLLGFFHLAKKTNIVDRRRFAWFFAFLLFAASFGLPALTTNRFGVIVWILTALLVLANQNDAYTNETGVLARRPTTLAGIDASHGR